MCFQACPKRRPGAVVKRSRTAQNFRLKSGKRLDAPRLQAAQSAPVSFVAWSVQLGHERLRECESWRDTVDGTIVAKPEQPAKMLEATLCRILSLALSAEGRDTQPCVLTAGGEFRVQPKELTGETHKREASKSPAVKKWAPSFCGGDASTKPDSGDRPPAPALVAHPEQDEFDA